MTTATATATRSVAERLRELRLEALSRWRGWAHAIAAGKPAPAPQEIIETAILLEIPHPGEALDADAEAVASMKQAEAAIVACERTRDEVLLPWKGDVAKLRAAVEQAESKVKDLRDVLDRAEDEFNAHYWKTAIYRLRQENPRVLGGIQ